MDRELLINIEESLGCGDEASNLLTMAESLKTDFSQPRVAIVGNFGAGKTTLINTMLGKRVRESQIILDELQKPLRVSFRRRENDVRMDCIEVVDSVWEEAVDALYVFELNNKVGVETIQPLLDEMDYFLYVVNAMIPMTKSDNDVLSRLPIGGVTLLVSHTDVLNGGRNQEKALQRLTDYIQDYCKSHGLPEPLFLEPVEPLEQDGKALGKRVRNCLPDEEALSALRLARAYQLEQRAVDLIRQKVMAAIYQNENDCEQAKSANAQDQMSLERKKAAWGAVRANLLESGVGLSKEVSDKLMDQADRLTQRLMDDGRKNRFTEKWCQTLLPKLMEQCMTELLTELEKEISVRIDRDVNALLKNAIDLQIVPSSFSLDGEVTVQTVDPKRFEKTRYSKNVQMEAVKIAGGTAAAATGGFLLLHASAPEAIVATATVAGVAAYKFVHLRADNEQDWMAQLKEYATLNLRKLANFVHEDIFQYYESIAEQIRQSSALQNAEFDNGTFDQRRRELEVLLQQLG